MSNDKTRITERFLTGIWRRQLVDREALTTSEGRKVKIVHPGRDNPDSGPDFCNALVAIDGDGLLRGDVEIHVRASDWYAHAHHRDPGYNGVILHVVWQCDQSKERHSLLENGGRTAILPVLGCLQQPVEELHPLVQSRQLLPQPCTAVLEHLGTKAITEALEQAGGERFLLQARQFEKELADSEAGQVLYEGLMGALGYTKNKETFQNLARGLPLSRLERLAPGRTSSGYVLDLQSLLLGTAGLLPGQCDTSDSSSWAKALEQRWGALGGCQRLSESQWRFFRVRPENFPTRRLAAASYLLARYRKGLLTSLMKLIAQAPPQQGDRVLEQGLVVTTSGYWARHFDFAQETDWSPTLLGRGRAGEIAVNVLLPFFFAWAEACSRPGLKSHVFTLFRQYRRLGENWITRYMQDQIFTSHRSRLIKSAQHQQGLLHLYKTFCTAGKCEGCPLYVSGRAG